MLLAVRLSVTEALIDNRQVLGPTLTDQKRPILLDLKLLGSSKAEQIHYWSFVDDFQYFHGY